MKSLSLRIDDKIYEVNLNEPLDISIPVKRDSSPNAFQLPKPVFSTFKDGDFVGNVLQGGSCNVENISFSPHGNGTHTECHGHITKEENYINYVLDRYFFLAQLVSVSVEDYTPVLAQQLPELSRGKEALIIRTHPNSLDKTFRDWNKYKTAWLSKEAVEKINDADFQHLLTDLPSLDKDNDATLTAHHAFFQNNPKKTVTEMIFVPDFIQDGIYLLNLMTGMFEADASPSKPVLYRLKEG